MMTYKIIIIGILIIFVYFNINKYKRIKRRMIIKKMKVDDNINDLICEFKKNIENNTELKIIQNKMRIIEIVKYVCYVILIILPILPILLSFIIIFYKIELKEKILSIDESYNISAVYTVLLVTEIIAFFAIEIYAHKNYQKNKKILKEYIYNDFLRNLKYDIKWYNTCEPTVSKKTYEMLNTYILWKEIYKKANFNKIQSDENIYQNTLLSNISHPNEMYFEDYISGIYKEKYIISMSDFRESIVTTNIGKKNSYLLYEGIFCVIKIDKNILNDIRITNDKKNSFFMEKYYMVTTMPKEFYKNFIILAKDGYKIAEKISAKSIEIIEKFYYNSKMKFDISIKNNEIFFRFKTIDSMELNIWRNIVDDLMLKEYANIIMFVTRLSEEINDNW